jgi:DeoR/GlpR family transcriptional regulator of sugar metabolism
MLREHRWQKIEHALAGQPFLEIRDLAKLLRVSDATVRRDIESLHQVGRVKRTRGGVTLQESNLGEDKRLAQDRSTPDARGDDSLARVASFSTRAKTNSGAKEKIGSIAATLIKDGQSLLIAGGSTPYAAAKNLRFRRVSVVTNSLPTATLLGETLGVDVLVTGGMVYPKHDILIGPQLKQTLENVRAADWLLMGASGASEEGFFDSNHLEVEAQHELMARAKNVALLLDATKFQRRDMIFVAAWDKIDVLVTDAPPPREMQAVLKKAKVRVLFES